MRVSLSSSLSGLSALVNRVPFISFLIKAILYTLGTRHPLCRVLPLAISHVSGEGGMSKPREDRTFCLRVQKRSC